jgi:acyl-CoA synthetase (AMP-forming)/AMP-acid ligase II
MTIIDMLIRNATQYPDDTALIELPSGDGKRKHITWAQFDERSNRFAHALQMMGIKKGDKVLHLMRNSINWLEIYFGIIKTGAWVVPLNFRFTAEDIMHCAQISEAQIMILDPEFVATVANVKTQMPNVTEYLVAGEQIPKGEVSFEEIIQQCSPDLAAVAIDEQDECGLYFTSGTTGSPKPILLTHRNMESAAVTEQAHHHQVKGDNFVLIPPLYHTGAKMHWFGSLLSGSKATLLKQVTPRHIFEAVNNERGTIVWILVPWAHDILAAMDRGELKKEDYDLSGWRLMHIGAQPVPPSLVQRWRKYFPEMQYDNNYGLTESTGPGCVHLGLENKDRLHVLGKAGDNWQVRVVNSRGKDMPPGDIGELIVKGGGVMREYYKNPEKTSETIKNGWLYTGDMARLDKEGFVTLVDRKKDVIISGGENVYPVEVEEVLHTHPKVYDVAVIGVSDERLVEAVAAVIDPKPGESLTKEEILRYCEERLPRYKRPRVVIFDKVPRNPTGKLEKVKLRKKYSGDIWKT